MPPESPVSTPPVRPSAPDLARKSSRMTPPDYTPPPERINIDETSVSMKSLPNMQIMNEQGELSPDWPHPDLSPEELLKIHRAMVLTRVLDQRMLTMQRQGQMGTFAPGYGQEATQIGQVLPLKTNDWFSPSYRSFGAQLWRGWTIEGLMLLWDGYAEGFTIPEGVNDLPFSIVIGSHVPTAVGLAMAAKRSGDDSVALVNFGDGALSQGIVSEALNFAAVDQAPVIFICENNGYAISTPVQKQAHNQVLALRGLGCDIPSLRIDGNDIFAMIQATTDAANRARSGGGPTFIEVITYRISLHTTADDPSVYRDDAEVEQWKKRDPLLRFQIGLLHLCLAQGRGQLHIVDELSQGSDQRRGARLVRPRYRLADNDIRQFRVQPGSLGRVEFQH